MFEKIQNWYIVGVYSKAMVKKLYEKGQLTQKQYAAIVGEE